VNFLDHAAAAGPHEHDKHPTPQSPDLRSSPHAIPTSAALAETTLSDSTTSAHALPVVLTGLTGRGHFAALFVNGHHHVTGAHILAVGAPAVVHDSP
jgi:hypothetical protein